MEIQPKISQWDHIVNTQTRSIQLVDEALFHARLHSLLVLATVFFVQLSRHCVGGRVGIRITQQ